MLSSQYQYYLNDQLQWYGDRDFNWREYQYNFVMGDYQIGKERWWKTTNTKRTNTKRGQVQY